MGSTHISARTKFEGTIALHFIQAVLTFTSNFDIRIVNWRVETLLFRLGKDYYKSKIVYETLNPTWCEQFDLYLYDQVPNSNLLASTFQLHLQSLLSVHNFYFQFLFTLSLLLSVVNSMHQLIHPFSQDLLGQILEISVWDKDQRSKDDFMGRFAWISFDCLSGFLFKCLFSINIVCLPICSKVLCGPTRDGARGNFMNLIFL